MRHSRFSATFSSVTAAVMAGALATTSVLPAAFAQGKPAPAKPAADKKTREAARKAYADGEKAYTSGDYAAAHDNFKKAHELIPTPHAEFWLAMSLAGQGKNEEAAKALEALLASPEASKIGDDKLAEAKSKLEELNAKLTGEVIIVTMPSGASVTIDGQAQMGETPMTVKLPAGSHKISVVAAGHDTKEVDVEVKPGEKITQSVELTSQEPLPPPVTDPMATTPPPAEPPPEPAPPPERRSKVPAYVTLGIAGAGAVVGTFFGIKALGAKSDFDDDPTTDNADDVERNALIADMAFGVAITLGVTGIVLLTSSDSGEMTGAAKTRSLPKKARLNVAPYVTHQGGGAAARLSF